MGFSLDRVLKALLFGAAGPLAIKDIQRVFTKYHEQLAAPSEAEEADDEAPVPEQPFLEAEGMPTSDVPSLVTSSQIREAMDRIAEALEESGEVFRMVERHNGFQLVSVPALGEWIRLLRNEPRPMKLTQSALETLAVIAYRQPAVRSEIENIRGVSIDSALNKLIERDLVMIVGRADLPGRPIQYGTTEQFLEFAGIRSLDELPASDVLSPRQINEWIHEVSNRKEVDETDMGLPEGDEAAEPEAEAAPEPADEEQAPAEPESEEDELKEEAS